MEHTAALVTIVLCSALVTWWGGSGGIEAYLSGQLAPFSA